MKPIRFGFAALALCAASCTVASEDTDPVTASADEAMKEKGIAQVLHQTNLVADQTGVASRTSPHLLNAWGLAFNPTAGLAWVSSNGAGLAQVYDSKGNHQLAVSVPVAQGQPRPSSPSGQVFNGDANAFAGDRFIFVTEGGTISGWQPTLGTRGAIRVDDSKSGAIYKGATIAKVDGHPRLYVTDFHNGSVDVYDENYKEIDARFVDRDIPAGYAPFNVQATDIGLIVTYAKQDQDKKDDVKGAGNGFVDLFDVHGRLVQRLISHAALNSPWGIAFAPDDFGRISNRLLVGNFGDGTIHAYRLEKRDGHYRVEAQGAIGKPGGGPLVIDGLWAIAFGPGTGGFGTDQLFFTAGPNDEQNGLFGRLDLP
ncbi:MAG: TIGR03118 family protein [Polyangiales bacterium]